MGLASADRWYIAAIVGGFSLLIHSPMVYNVVEGTFESVGLKGAVTEMERTTPMGRLFGLGKPTYFGVFLHSLVLFFATFGILHIDWNCS